MIDKIDDLIHGALDLLRDASGQTAESAYVIAQYLEVLVKIRASLDTQRGTH